MKVYIVMRGEMNYGGEVVGVFATPTKAEELANTIRNSDGFLQIDTVDVLEFEVQQ